MGGLKKSIVIVNEYTLYDGKKGSRGSTPGTFVTDYEARTEATEVLTPVQSDFEPFVNRYIARATAVDSAPSLSAAKKKALNVQGQGGVTFGYGSASLTDDELKVASTDIQDSFLKGKTVMKMVISFEEDFLKEHGVIDKNFVFYKEGDYRGNVDELKLRLAIMKGMEYASRSYDDLRFVGAIHVNTKNVHSHVVFFDNGDGRTAKDGSQKGKIPQRVKKDIRRGIESFLDEKQVVKSITSAIRYDRNNVKCAVKKYAYDIVKNRGFYQFLVSVLPENQKMWRAGTNRKEMKKANALMRDFVMSVFEKPDSGYDSLLANIHAYADTRQKVEDLSDDERDKLIKNGINEAVNTCINDVYKHLRQNITKDDRLVRTPLLESMSMPYEDMANLTDTDPLIDFGFRFRSYSSRVSYHKEQSKKFKAAIEMIEDLPEVSEDAASYIAFLKHEREWNEKLTAKYGHFLNFMPAKDAHKETIDKIRELHDRIENLTKMTEDADILADMMPSEAERYGLEHYGERGGKFFSLSRTIIPSQIESLQRDYDRLKGSLDQDLMAVGLDLDEDYEIIVNDKYDFDDVKALDIHHLSYDFPNDTEVSPRLVSIFKEEADKRFELMEKARLYLVNSGQGDKLDEFPINDIIRMKNFADDLEKDHTLYSLRDRDSAEFRRSDTVSLDSYKCETVDDMEEQVIDNIHSIQMGE